MLPALGGCFSSVGAAAMCGRDGEGWRSRVLGQCPCPALENAAAALQSSLIPQSRGWRRRLLNPQGWGQAFDVPAWALPARALPFIYFSTSSCHPLFLSFPSSDSAWMWGKWNHTPSCAAFLV